MQAPAAFPTGGASLKKNGRAPSEFPAAAPILR